MNWIYDTSRLYIWPHFLPYCHVIFTSIHKIAKSGYYLHHVCLSIHMEQLSSHYMDFYQILYIFPKIEKFLKSY